MIDGTGDPIPARQHFLVELGSHGDITTVADAARKASRKARSDGVDARFVRAVYVPEDERCFLLFEGKSAGDVLAVAQLAELEAAAVRPVLKQTDTEEDWR